MNLTLQIHENKTPKNSSAMSEKKILTSTIGLLVIRIGKHTDVEVLMAENLND